MLCEKNNYLHLLFNKDKNWIQIRKYFKNKGVELHVFTSIFEDGQDQR